MSEGSVGLEEVGSVTAPGRVLSSAPCHSLFILHPFSISVHSEADHLMLLLANHLIQVARGLCNRTDGSNPDKCQFDIIQRNLLYICFICLQPRNYIEKLW